MNTKTKTVERTCGNCGRWTQHTDARMADYGECEQRPTAHYTHRSSTCVLLPFRWVKR